MLFRSRPAIILDVAHNPHAAAVLAANLDSLAADAKPGSDTIAVFGMLHDKDVAGVCAALKGRIDKWHVAGLPGPRGSTAEALRETIRATDVIADIATYPSITAAFAAARDRATVDDRIVAFGSFLTVADVILACRISAPRR